MKIKFFTSGIFPRSGGDFGVDERHVINPNYLYLKHFYSIHGKCPTIEWLMPEFFRIYGVDEALQIIKDEKPDVLALSMFVWNFDFHLLLAQSAKQTFPDIKIVIGGPELSVHKNPGFFHKHDYIDYVVYGDGELAFTQLIDFFAGSVTDKTKWVNIVENDNGTEITYPYERLTDTDFFSSSPYIEQKQFLLDCLDYNMQQFAKHIGGTYKPEITIEFARGCMYSCTFCDWSQNLTKKVKRGHRDFFKDIDLIHDLDLSAQASDANFGQWSEDLEIFDYALSKFDPKRNFRLAIKSTPKLKKKAAEYIIQKQFEYYSYVQHIAVQDLDDTVLKNINRPSISKQDHFDMINQLKSKISTENFDRLSLQIIVGLPGQTFERTQQLITEILCETGLSKYIVGTWILLENSPANNLFYQKTHKLQFDKTYQVLVEHSGHDLEFFYQRATNNDLKLFYTTPLVTQSGDQDFWDIQKIKALYQQVSRTPASVFKNKTNDQIKNIIERLASIATKYINQQKKLHQPLVDKYNVRLLSSYDEHHKKIFCDL